MRDRRWSWLSFTFDIFISSPLAVEMISIAFFHCVPTKDVFSSGSVFDSLSEIPSSLSQSMLSDSESESSEEDEDESDRLVVGNVEHDGFSASILVVGGDVVSLPMLFADVFQRRERDFLNPPYFCFVGGCMSVSEIESVSVVTALVGNVSTTDSTVVDLEVSMGTCMGAPMVGWIAGLLV